MLSLEISGYLVGSKVEVEELVESIRAFGCCGETDEVSGTYIEEGFDEGFGSDTMNLIDDDEAYVGEDKAKFLNV